MSGIQDNSSCCYTCTPQLVTPALSPAPPCPCEPCRYKRSTQVLVAPAHRRQHPSVPVHARLRDNHIALCEELLGELPGTLSQLYLMRALALEFRRIDVGDAECSAERIAVVVAVSPVSGVR